MPQPGLPPVSGLARLGLSSCLLFCCLAAPPAFADEPSGQPADPPARQRRDFLFGAPHASIGFRGSWVFARTGSDLFEFVEDQLTVEQRDFDTPALGVDLGVALNDRFDVVFGLEYARAEVASEYRDYVDNNRLPITQNTRFTTLNLSGSVRYALVQRGETVGRYAWVPAPFVPFVGAGGGYMRYEFEQTGDFVDYQDLSVFGDFFQSEGWTPSAHVFGGVDFRVFRALYASVEARYVWADAKLSSDFVGFDPIDLAGFRIAGGLNLLF